MDEPIIDLHSDQYFMGEALRQALQAYEAEEVPVGAVVVREGRIIGRAFNQVELLKDATAHAEMLALTQAEEVVGDWRLIDCTVYVTKEPCPMCAGAMVHTRLARLVYGAADLKGGAAGSALRFGAWNFSGAWSLGFKASQPSHSDENSEEPDYFQELPLEWQKKKPLPKFRKGLETILNV